MPLTREEAWAQLCAWTATDSLRRHALAVEASMRAAAPVFGGPEADVERWGIAGLLHDADYEAWPEEHPQRIVAWLRERGEEALAYAISAHYSRWGVPHLSALDKALLATDELTGFVCACSYIRPDGIRTLTPKSVQKRLRARTFAAGVDREEVQAGLDLLGVEAAVLIQLIIEALRPQAAPLGLLGTQG